MCCVARGVCGDMKLRPQVQLRFRDEGQWEGFKELASSEALSLNEWILRKLENGQPSGKLRGRTPVTTRSHPVGEEGSVAGDGEVVEFGGIEADEGEQAMTAEECRKISSSNFEAVKKGLENGDVVGAQTSNGVHIFQ